MRLDDIPAEAWRRAVEDEVKLLGQHEWRAAEVGKFDSSQRMAEQKYAVEQVAERARRIAAEMAKVGVCECGYCGGTGNAEAGGREGICAECGGTGELPDVAKKGGDDDD